MDKNGKPFVSVVGANDFISSVWDPYVYRVSGSGCTLSDFATIYRVTAKNYPSKRSPFRPVQYRDIPKGNYLSFVLRPGQADRLYELPSVSEGQLLFGTMRAYLANVAVTPVAEWVNQSSPLYLPVKSEFVVISPEDGLIYFWLVYMRSEHFLQNLPIGSGGTRPRLQPEALGNTPVEVPSLEIRTRIHQALLEVAATEWRNYSRASSVISSMNSSVEVIR